MTDDEHPQTDRVVLPDVRDSSAPPIELDIPGPPRLPNAIDRESTTQPPGTYEPPAESFEEQILGPIRKLVEGFNQNSQQDRDNLRAEMSRLAALVERVCDPNAGLLAATERLTSVVLQMANDLENRIAVLERKGFDPLRIERLEWRMAALESWRESFKDDGK